MEMLFYTQSLTLEFMKNKRNKFIEIQEFDYISKNESHKSTKKCYKIDGVIFDEIEDMILSLGTEFDEISATNFLNIKADKNVGKVIYAKNYVGLIELNSGFQIQVLPKIFFHDSDDEIIQKKKSKQIFLKMLKSLKNTPGKVFTSSALDTDKMNLNDIFINMYIQEVRNLLKLGLKSGYVSKTETLNYYKGKVNFAKDIVLNHTHKERNYSTYDNFEINVPENKLIKSTLKKLLFESDSPENILEIKQILGHLDMVEESTNFHSDFNKVQINRGNNYYQEIIKWSKVFLKNESFTTFTGYSMARSILFPMESIFESYVSKYLKKAFQQTDYHVSVQDKGYYLFDDPKRFKLRPDIVISSPSNGKVIIDTKWKRLINNKRKNYGISQSDMYQLYAYSKKYNANDVWLFYPLNSEFHNYEGSITYRSNDDDVNIHVYVIDLNNIICSINKFKEEIVN